MEVIIAGAMLVALFVAWIAHPLPAEDNED